MAKCPDCAKYHHSQCTGRHRTGRAVGKQCDCVCTYADGPPVSLGHMHGVSLAPEQLALYAAMQEVEMVIFFTRTLDMKFTPRTLPPELRQQMKQPANQVHMLMDLAPWGEYKNIVRPGWSTGAVGQCYGCGGSCVTQDPLANTRHTGCGWLEQIQPTRGLAGARIRARATHTPPKALRAAAKPTAPPTNQGEQ